MYATTLKDKLLSATTRKGSLRAIALKLRPKFQTHVDRKVRYTVRRIYGYYKSAAKRRHGTLATAKSPLQNLPHFQQSTHEEMRNKVTQFPRWDR